VSIGLWLHVAGYCWHIDSAADGDERSEEAAEMRYLKPLAVYIQLCKEILIYMRNLK
jgi:hypothetical protein